MSCRSRTLSILVVVGSVGVVGAVGDAVGVLPGLLWRGSASLERCLVFLRQKLCIPLVPYHLH